MCTEYMYNKQTNNLFTLLYTISLYTGDSDSGLPSCSPLDDEHEYMLDGFDFSTGVSICQTLASDSEEESNDPIPNNANKYQLTTALMNVLNIPGEHQEGVVNETPTRSLRVMTLDEIEEPHPQDNGDQDQTAFNKLLAAINSPRGSEPRPQRNEPHPQKPPQEVSALMYMYMFKGHVT